MGNIFVPSEMVPISNAQALADANYLRGGFMSVADTTARDAIPASRRKLGLVAYVQSNGMTYILVGGIANGNWTSFLGTASSYASGFTGSTIVFTHNLGFYPNAQFITTSGDLLLGKIQHNSTSRLSVYFNTSFAGTGYFS